MPCWMHIKSVSILINLLILNKHKNHGIELTLYDYVETRNLEQMAFLKMLKDFYLENATKVSEFNTWTNPRNMVTQFSCSKIDFIQSFPPTKNIVFFLSKTSSHGCMAFFSKHLAWNAQVYKLQSLTQSACFHFVCAIALPDKIETRHDKFKIKLKSNLCYRSYTTSNVVNKKCALQSCFYLQRCASAVYKISINEAKRFFHSLGKKSSSTIKNYL